MNNEDVLYEIKLIHKEAMVLEKKEIKSAWAYHLVKRLCYELERFVDSMAIIVKSEKEKSE